MPTDPYLSAALDAVTPAADNVTPALAFPLQQCLDSNDPARCYDPQLIRCAAAATLQDQESAITRLKAKYGPDFNKTLWRRQLNRAEVELRRSPRDDDAPAWESALLTSDKGKPLAAVENALIAFRSAPEWRGVLNFDLSSMNIVVKCPPPWKDKRKPPFIWNDSDDTRATAWLERQGVMLKANTVAQAIQTVAQDYSFHPIRDYLSSLEWDKQERIDLWLETYLGVRPPEGDISEAAQTLGYIRAVAAKFLIGAIARVMQPGCKHDTCLILEGPQGARKSTALRTLFDPWFTDDMPDIHTKDASMQTRGVWLIEFGELDNLSKADVSRIKVFMTRAVDRFRPPYGRRVIECPRESVFAGTVNQQTYLRDETGGRRFWPIVCGHIDIESLGNAKDMLWAEAVARYNEPNATWWLDDADVVRESAQQQESRYEQDPWQELISPWLDRPTQRIWGQEAVDPYTSTADSTTVLEVLLHAIGKRYADITQADKNRVSQCIRAIGWVRRKAGTRAQRQYRYVRPAVEQA